MMSARNTVKVKDTGWNKLKRTCSKVNEKVVAVGIQGKEAEQDHGGTTNVLIGSVHEFGAPNKGIPQRSFIRSTETKNRKKYQKELDEAAGKCIDGKDFEAALLLVGEQFRADIINAIKKGIPPPLSAATIAKRKGDATPLWDTGQLVNSLSAVVRKKK